jgi:hypothetical protein
MFYGPGIYFGLFKQLSQIKNNGPEKIPTNTLGPIWPILQLLFSVRLYANES